MSTEAQAAERALLSILIKKPNAFFSIDDVITEADFVNTGSAMIFSIVKDLIVAGENTSIDQHLIFSEAERKGLESFFHHTLNGELVDAIESIDVSDTNIGWFVATIKQASIKRALISTCDDLKDNIDTYVGDSVGLRNMVETRVLDSLDVLDTGQDDIINLSDDFEEIIETYADQADNVGIDIGLPKYQKDVGGILNGTVTGFFASTKVGKSQLSMWASYMTAVVHRLPVLYLDTEMQARQQQMRLCGALSGIDYGTIKEGSWKSDRGQINRIKKAFEIVKGAPIFYKNIAGRSVHNVIPTVRKFVYQQMGGIDKSDKPRGLCIYDYIKMMDSQDLTGKLQEYQLIGLLMSHLHDCANHLNIPIIALGQLNKQEDIGIRRIVENVDSATILRPKTPEEVQEDGPARGSHALEIRWTRNGIGHGYNEWINLHFDKSCGQFKEDKRNTEVFTAVRKLKQQMEIEDTQKLSEVQEDF